MSITIDIPASIETILEKRAREQHLEKESILRQMLWDGAERYLVEEYSKGNVSKGKLAEMLEMDIYEVNELLEKYHIKSNLDLKTFVKGVEIAEKYGRYDSGKDDSKK
ncbi:hypothetical protein Mpsy_0604 [Methanolobus psychrophilus R15]|nr:hypothetical protein Mpsy_0604 [Methanolobus psychrophilus R15]